MHGAVLTRAACAFYTLKSTPSESTLVAYCNVSALSTIGVYQQHDMCQALAQCVLSNIIKAEYEQRGS